MKLFFFILICGAPFISFSQTDTTFITYDRDVQDDTLIYETDTIINEGLFGRAVLAGTTVLPYSRNNIYAIGYGFELKKIDFSPCKRSRDVVRLSDSEVISITKNDSLWICELKVVENCCYDFLCEISIENENTLNFIYTGYGDHCGCNCCYGLVYEIAIEDFGSGDIQKVTHTMLNGKEETLKPIN